MGDTPEEQATKDAFAVQGMWKRGKGLSVNTPDDQAMATFIQRYGRTMAESALPMAGGTVGAVGGAALGFPEFSIPFAMMGAGAGAAAGEALNPLAFKAVGATPPQSMTGNRGWDVALTGGLAGVGEGVGQGITRVGGKILSRFLPEAAPGAQATADAFRATGVQPKVSDVAPNMAALERSVAQTPTGGQILRDVADRQAGQLGRARDEFLNKIAPASAGERMVTGEKASAAIGRQVERTGALEDALWKQMGENATDLPVKIGGIKSAASDVLLQEQRGLTPNAKLVSLAEKILQHGDEVPWQVADAWRKEFGRNITSGELISGLPSGENKLLYRSLLNDMEAAAGQSPGLADSYKNLRNFSEHRRAIFRDGEVAKILETDPEKVVGVLNAAGGPSAIKRAREAIMGSGELGSVMPTAADREAWDYVRRHILEGAFNKAVNEEYKGLANPVIVGSRLDKALKQFGEDGLKELLTPTELTALENIKIVAKAMRSSERIGALPGTSTTPQGMGFMDIFRSPGVLAGGAVGSLLGGPSGALTGASAGGFASFVLVPHILAKALTNPAAAQVIASPGFRALSQVGTVGAKAAEQGTQALARLAGILTAESQGGQ